MERARLIAVRHLVRSHDFLVSAANQFHVTVDEQAILSATHSTPAGVYHLVPVEADMLSQAVTNNQLLIR